MLKQITKVSGEVAWCEHIDCHQAAVRIVAADRPRHHEFKGRAHYCCERHSRPGKGEKA